MLQAVGQCVERNAKRIVHSLWNFRDESMENMIEKTQLLGMTPEELGAFFKEQGQPAFRAKQVFAWLHQGVPFEKMSNLP